MSTSRSRRAPESESSPGHDRWLLSYADFMTLLLALFVVLYASAIVDDKRDASLFAGLQAAFIFDSNSPAPTRNPDDIASSARIAEDDLAPVPYLAELEENLASVIDRLPREPGEDPGMSLRQTERGLVLSLASAEFFPAGGVDLPPERKEALAAIAPFFAANDASILFEGHTDDRPTQSGPYPSNWELSAARASAVARYFMDEHGLDPTRVTTSGYAAFRPLASNEDAAGRARNRRVEIVILEDGVVVPEEGSKTRNELDELLEELPPLPPEADETLKPADLGPPPKDIPLP